MKLTCDPAGGSLWVLPGVGTLRRTGRISRAATAEAVGRRWSIVRFGWVRTGFRAADEAGVPVGELPGKLMGRSEALRWGDRALTLRPDPARRGGHVLRDGERPLATMAPEREGKRPLDVVVEDSGRRRATAVMAFVVRAYSDDASFPAPTGG